MDNKNSTQPSGQQHAHELVEALAKLQPDALALACGPQHLSYAALNRRANQLAHGLRRLGIGPETPVGVCVRRSPEMLVSWLAVLKAGGAYVPLEPDYPHERLAFMLADTQAPVLLTQQALLDKLPTYDGQIICLDADWGGISQECDDDLPPLATNANLAYVIYTSGSTGQPKGVQVEGDALLNLIHWHQHAFAISPADRASQLASPAFDASVWETWPHLTAGASLHLPDEETRAFPARLRDWLVEQAITISFWPTPLAELGLGLGWPPHLALRILLTGGDQLHRHPPATLPFALVNNYGPTENAVVTTSSVVPPAGPGRAAPPIGRPIANVHVYILDQNGQPSPANQPGEIYIGGDSLSRGYLQRPDLTAGAFVPNPFSARPGDRLYRSGDLARWRPDGQLEFLGRQDHQIKLRGFRIELGEIEAVLGQHPAVREAAAAMRDDGPGGKRLVAYVVEQAGRAIEAAELRHFLKDRLPEYMLPSAFVMLPGLPLTPSGKVDRRALSTLPAPRPEAADAYIPPRTPTEKTLVELWAQVLGQTRVGVFDNFFEMGGHSLLATLLISRIRDVLQLELPLQALFESPTPAQLAGQVDWASQARPVAPVAPLTPVARQRGLPLSFAQQRLWFLEQWQPGNPAYHILVAYRLEGQLDVAALKRSLRDIVRRHEALRTAFTLVDGQPVQVIYPDVRLATFVADLGDLPRRHREAEVARLGLVCVQQAFDLTHGPLLRAGLVRLAEDEHVLILAMHHIVSDGWSMGVFARELAAFYQLHTDQPAPVLAGLPIQYADFAVWQRAWLSDGERDKQLAYWKEQLDGAPTVLELPADRPRPPAQTYAGAHYFFALPRTLTTALKTLSQQTESTLFMTLLTAFNILLYRYTGQTDLLVGVPIANRNRSEIEGLIGFFVNMLVMRGDLSGDPTFRAALERVRRAALAAYQHQDLPFETLVEALRLERDVSRSPLFQVMFIFQNTPATVLDLPGLRLSELKLDARTAQFDLTLEMLDSGPYLEGVIEYNTDLFAPETIARLAGHLQVLLEGITANPDRGIADLPLLGEAEQHQIVIEWNQTARAYPPQACVHSRFETQAQQIPDATAVMYEDQHLSYAALNRRANQLAHTLRGLGVSTETLVGVSMERSLEMIVGLLAVMKAGGAYVPLDPTYPRERLALMLEDSQAAVLLTHSQLLDSLPPHQARVVCLDSDWATGQHTHNPVPLSSGDNLAYTIYTSGSTGRPKGVQVLQRSVVNFLESMRGRPGLSSHDVLLSVTTISFDIAGLELFLPLTSGARVVVVSRATAADGQALMTSLAASHATMMQATPATWRLLLDAGWDGDRGLKVLVGGEALPDELARRLTERCGTVWNMYGPTETTIWSCLDEVQPATKTVTIGYPIANTSVYILDKRLCPTPIGVPGGLYIGGDGLARGYFKRPDLSAAQFVPDPFSRQAGARMYSTGDLARFRADGRIEFLGRQDHQVKVRGFRIELGDIEAALSQHPAVRQVVVLAREDRPGEKRLVAYLVGRAGWSLAAGELRRFLKDKLPDYMLPSLFVSLEAFPLTPSGKIDRRALQALPVERDEAEMAYVAPRTPAEEMLANLWAQILDLPQVSANDDFFELGGHSLLATRLVSRLRSALRVELPLRTLFESSRLAAMAERVNTLLVATSGSESPQPIPPLARQVHTGDAPLSFAQQRLWFLEQWQPGSPHYNNPSALHLNGPLDVGRLKQCLHAIVRRHETLRTSFVSRGADEQPVQVIAPSLVLDLPVVDVQALSEAGQPSGEVERIVAEAARQPFDLACAPLVRVLLVQWAPDRHMLLLNMHHIISDGWSTDVFIQELAALYRAFSTGAPWPLPELPIQYADFAIWQRAWLQGEALESQLAYWKRHLAGALPVLELPTDRPRPAVQSLHGALWTFTLPTTLLQALEALSRQESVTLFMTLLAAFKVLLYRYSGQTDIIIGTPIANRNQAELEGLIGVFVNTLVMRVDLSGQPAFRSLLRQVRQVAMGAYTHQDMPFEKLVEELQPQRDLSHSPLFQVMFILQNAPVSRPALPDLGMKLEEVDNGTAKFDLTLHLRASANGLEGAIEYNTDLFDPASIARLADHFQVLLEGILADPACPITALPLLSAREQQQLLVEWNDTRLDYPDQPSIHSLFEAQVQRSPDAIALVYQDQHLSYAALNRQANQIAHALRDLGVGPETLVGVCLQRTALLPAGLLGVLKAGGAYVPLDAAYPPERLAYMLADSRAAVLLTQSDLKDCLPDLSGLGQTAPRWLYLDSDAPAIAGQSQADPASNITSDNLAYLIYTSGSTGWPKGVAIAHRSALALLQWAKASFDPQQWQGVLASTSICFDLSIFELFTPLSWGGRVILAENALHLPTLPAAADVRLVNSVPSAAAELLRLKGLPPSVHTLNLAGEPLTAGLVRELYGLGTLRAVYDLYGPSEDTTYSTWALRRAGGPETIGRPIANTRLYILDPFMRPAPLGVVGEVYLGGEGLARGYLERPDLTAERFVPDPFSAGDPRSPGARLYRTGDLARFLPDGNVAFLGRSDHQIKLRGFRIELGEIEAALKRHPAVRQAVVMIREDQPGDRRLAAFVVKQAEAELETGQLRDFIKDSLPDYMLPAAFTALEALPLTPSGKIDRRALQAMPISGWEAGGGAYTAPRTPLEEVLAGMWAQILGRSQVGIHDNFFELGGHSLLATRVVSRLRDTLRVELPLRALFESPSVASLAGRIASGQTGTAELSAPPLMPAGRAGRLPLSYAQQRLWFLDQLEPNSPNYNIPLAAHLEGQLDIGALTRSIEAIVQRHEALRTTFAVADGQPVQIIAEQTQVRLPVIDLSTLAAAATAGTQAEAALQSMMHREARRPFDLTRGPLLRTRLFRLDERRHVLLLNMHHIISDGWSLDLFMRELARLYQAESQGQAANLPEMAVQYADFAAWQRAWLSGPVLEDQLAYWRQQLGGELPTLELPADHPRPAVQSQRGAVYTFTLPAGLRAGLEHLSRAESATLFMTILAAFKVLLYRYTGQTDIAVGTPVAGRQRSEIEDLIGFFVNTLVVRSDLSGDPSFRELLRQVRGTALAAYAHQDAPFEMLVEELRPQRDMSHNPLFQVLFMLQNAPTETLGTPELALTLQEVDSGTAKFDLTLEIVDSGQVLQGALEYSTDLFEPETIARLAGHFQVLLEGIINHPDQCIADMPLLSQAEQRRVVEWGGIPTDYPRQQCVHTLFEAQAQRTPDAVALVYEDQHLSYAALNQWANQLAHALRRRGVGPETLVGVCLERSLELVAGLLGVLKAGGGYVPLGADYPPERLAFMLADTQTPVLLTQAHLAERLPVHPGQVLCLDTNRPELAAESQADPLHATTPDNLIYVMYTSGSTGRPKGVSVTHRSVVRLVKANHYAGLTAEEVLLQFAPVAFDASTLEIWGSLLNGARLVIFPAHTPSLAELGQVLRRQSVTTLWLTAGLFHVMVDEQLEGLRGVRQLLAGGDVLSAAHVQKVLDELPNCRVINGYGPTENTTFTACHPMSSVARVRSPLPIGRPIANTQVYILDHHMQPTPAGVPGELYTGGDGLARCYLNRPELTASSFVPNPFDPGQDGVPGTRRELGSRRVLGSRLYRTGDWARWRPDGSIEFLGRRDDQVKIRGFRIELGEIEAALSRHPAVREAVVVACQDRPGDKRLVAYVVKQAGIELESGELRRFLKDSLPDYMLPTACVALEAFPLSPNGKVDRHALQTRAAQLDRGEAGTYTAPRTPLEDVLVSIWARVLNLAQVSIHNNFFELGGHSLLATQIMSRLRDALQVELPLRVLFESPTIAGLAAKIEDKRHARQALWTATIPPVERKGTLAASFAQRRLWFLDQWEPNSPYYNIPLAAHFEGPLNIGALRRSIEAIIQRHETLRTTFAVEDGQPIQVIAERASGELPVIDLSPWAAASASIIRDLMQDEARRPFDLACGPLLRTRLFRLGDRRHVLLLNMHHIISDGWSLGVFMRELAALYQAESQGQATNLPALVVQYADFAAWQRAWLSGPVLEDQLAYWRQQLGGELPILELPADHPRPAVQSQRGAVYAFALPASLRAGLERLSREEGATLFMTLLAAFKVLLFHYTRQTDIAVGTPVAGRQRSEVEDMIGFFVNTLVMRSDLSGNPSFRELLGRVRETALGAYAHQDTPFEMLVEELRPQRDLSHSPLFQVLFALQNMATEWPVFPDLAVHLQDVESGTAKFDLSLLMWGSAQGLEGVIEYNTDLFEPGTIARLAKHWRVILECIADQPQQRLADIPYLTQAERRQVLDVWSKPPLAYEQGNCIHALFEAQARRTPDAIALVFRDTYLTFEALDRRANQLAHHLVRLGARPETLVALCMQRGLEMIIAILGVLKSGAAYVPLDATFPKERKAILLADTQARLLLTQHGLKGCLPAFDGQVIAVDTDWPGIEMSPADAAPQAGSADNLAYVIYTSGSTGTPKGVMITHANLSPLLHWGYRHLGFTPQDRAIQYLSYCFDWSVWEIFLVLTSGASLIMITEDTLLDPQASLDCVLENGAAILHATPTQFQFLTNVGRRLPSLKHACIGAEKLGLELVERCHDLFEPECRIFNMYGPTEAAIITTILEVDRGHLKQYAGLSSAPIGPPVANARCYILNKGGHPQAVGIPGELFIAGDGLACGYLNRPGLTAERFVPDPFCPSNGARMYRTGDLARWLPDGSIEFLGRIDQQVKLRGFRIELGEIESVLGQYPGVREAVVVVREDKPGDKRLAAYMVLNQGQALVTNEIRSFLQNRLPDYMLPAAFVSLEALPLTTSGKLDRRALQAMPIPGWEASSGAYTAPRTPQEEVLAGVWAQVLDIPQVSVHANFFELGGHSLLATRVVSRIRDALQVELPLRALFESPSVASLAGRIASGQAGTAEMSAPPLMPAGRAGRLPLSFAQQRLWFLDQWEPGDPLYNIYVTLRLTGKLKINALAHSLNQMVRRHEALRTLFVTADDQPIQVILPDLDLALPVIDLSGLPEPERELRAQQVIADETLWRFNLQTGPLIRASLLRVGPETHMLVLNMHHIISDGWSMSILTRELAAFYAANLTGQPAPLADLPIQYADFAVWQRAWLQGEALETQRAYWKQRLGDQPAPLDLPTDWPRPPVQTYRGGLASLRLPVSLSQALRTLSQRESCSLFMTLLAAFKVLLYRYTGQTDILVGSPIAGRNRGEIEGLIGFFLNTLVLRTDLAGHPSFRQVLQRVREATLGAYAHQDMPFEQLLEALHPERDLSRTPLFQVLFNMLNLPDSGLEMPELHVENVPLSEAGAKFDLTVYVAQASEAIEIDMVYNTDLFSQARVNELLEQFQQLLAQVTHDPEKEIAHFSLLTDRARALVPDPTQALDAAWEGSIQARFSLLASRFPDRLALVDSQTAWTYGELEARSNQLAHYLRSHGVRPQDRVAIYGYRAAELVWAVMGVLKAGAAFLILDPAYPSVRLMHYLSQADPRGWLQLEVAGQPPQEVNDHIQSLPNCCRLTLSWQTAVASDGPLAGYSRQDPGLQVGPDDLAYLAFTSGSTGDPLGIRGRHGSLTHFLPWQTHTLEFTPSDRFSMLSGLAHDPLHRDMFTALWLGASVCIPDPEDMEPRRLPDWMQQQAISVTHLTPAMSQILTATLADDAPADHQLTALRRAFFVGDLLTRRDVARLRQLAPQVVCVNSYGSTETQRAVGYFIVPGPATPPTEEHLRDVWPLGRGMKDVQLLVLSESGQLAGIYEPGEIYVRSPHLALGYLAVDELTQARFIVNPFSGAAGDRLYKTGDLGYYRPDGNVEFLGRRDYQVKIRGFRIELREIEAALSQHPSVQDCVVVAREDTPGDKRLVAYGVTRPEETLAANDLRNFLKNKLPTHMLPSAFVLLDKLPLTPNAKVDRRALPSPEISKFELEAAFTPARSPLEQTLTEVWANLLRIERVGIHDNFFELGGHSLLATQVVSRVRDEFKVNLSLRSLFETPTVAGLAQVVEGYLQADTSAADETLSLHEFEEGTL